MKKYFKIKFTLTTQIVAGLTTYLPSTLFVCISMKRPDIVMWGSIFLILGKNSIELVKTYIEKKFANNNEK